MILASGILLALVLAAFSLDYTISVIGLRKGVALEGNWVVQKLFGLKPSPWQLFVGLLPQEVSAVVIGVLLLKFYIGFGVLLGIVVRHLQNYFAWKRLGA
jgi:hypothetical protein